MELTDLSRKLGISEASKPLIRKAEELRRLCDVRFDSSLIGVGEVCKSIICLEIAASRLQAMFDRQAAIRVSGMSEKAYIRSSNALQNCLGVKFVFFPFGIGIQFGCVRLIPFVQKGLSAYKERFLAALPASRRATTDFSRPVFTAVAFYLSAKKHKLKVDKLKLIELCGTSESEFTSVSTSMNDLCFDSFGISKEKKAPSRVKGNRELLDALPEKRRRDDDDDLSDDSSVDGNGIEHLSSYQRHKQMKKLDYKEWKSSVVSSNKRAKIDVSERRTKQAQLSFVKESPKAVVLDAS
ncbi:Origin recognition complex subunit 6 [Acorus calamus]|uniref:Origin recognition complex subunit 6 n=1 Tax=Acorus calamus TaxID=4465 RepID=A0AAV9C8B3_ACOCL|nr:Origin recognition complex subunit 6 [Acorus calamus]